MKNLLQVCEVVGKRWVTGRNGLTVRIIEPHEMRLIEQWAALEGWNPGIRDVDCYLAGDRSGFFVALEHGTPVGGIFTINYSDKLCMGGAFIVCQECRGKSVGIALAKKAAAYAGARTFVMDAVENKVSNYASFGFKAAYGITRYEMSAGMPGKAAQTVDLTDIPFNELKEYDFRHFPADRSSLLSEWIRQKPTGEALGITRNGKLAGYGVIRKAFVGYRMEPLYADSPEIAAELMGALCRHANFGEPVYLNIPLPNNHARALAERHMMKPVIHMVRMYHGIVPENRLLACTYSQMG